jgi:hypothetical protein
MPVTAATSEPFDAVDAKASAEPPKPEEISLSSLEQIVTSSIVEAAEGFCSESDADCSVRPTAALLTQDNLKTEFPSTTASADHFLGVEASRESEEKIPSTVRPDNTGSDDLAEKNGSDVLSGNDENAIATGETRKKSDRRADGGSGSGLPDVNDIISGLLNVVGEGLTIATNYVKEEHKRKKEALASQVI